MNLIYLDSNATCPPSGTHLESLFKKLRACSGNPSSPHAIGREASVAVTIARRALAKAMEVDVAEIVFVSGGTEADNLGTVGVLNYNLTLQNDIQHAITSTVEHPAIRESLVYLNKSKEIELTHVQVDSKGFISLTTLIASLQPNTTLVTIMAANNEIGSIQPTKKFGDFLHFMRWGIARSDHDKLEFENLALHLQPNVTAEVLKKLHFHVDAVQAFGKIKNDLWFSAGIDSCALSGHKLGALQGIGALFLRRGRKYKPFILGGAQEKSRRAGTENIPGIVSFGLIAAEICSEVWWQKNSAMEQLKNYFYKNLYGLPGIEMNSSLENSLPNTVNFSLRKKKLKAEDLLVELDMQGVCASTGSACSSGANLPSHVILALGKSTEDAKNALRFSLSHSNTYAEIDQTISFIKKYLM